MYREILFIIIAVVLAYVFSPVIPFIPFPVLAILIAVAFIIYAYKHKTLLREV